MITTLRQVVGFTLLMTLLCGLIYPLGFTGLAQLLLPRQADGSLVLQDGKVIGSELIAQGFAGDGYFHPRPSAAGSGYDAANSSGSNLAVSNKASNTAIIERATAARGERTEPVPADLVTASGSGLDPHLSPAAALFQVPRVAAARGLPESQVAELVRAHTESRPLGILGEPRVNVLRLNLALDALRDSR
ncbi:MAG: potassium-transporting ATPase subunit KdpC [Sinimarinibacterium sp.]|jgi:K+-transporting ATPase ATPase C chain